VNVPTTGGLTSLQFHSHDYHFSWDDSGFGALTVTWACPNCHYVYTSENVKTERDLGMFILEVKRYSCLTNKAKGLSSIFTAQTLPATNPIPASAFTQEHINKYEVLLKNKKGATADAKTEEPVQTLKEKIGTIFSHDVEKICQQGNNGLRQNFAYKMSLVAANEKKAAIYEDAASVDVKRHRVEGAAVKSAGRFRTTNSSPFRYLPGCEGCYNDVGDNITSVYCLDCATAVGLCDLCVSEEYCPHCEARSDSNAKKAISQYAPPTTDTTLADKKLAEQLLYMVNTDRNLAKQGLQNSLGVKRFYAQYEDGAYGVDLDEGETTPAAAEAEDDFEKMLSTMTTGDGPRAKLGDFEAEQFITP
jgi:hypothetical protein